jgi:hypothetical protein
MKIVEILIKLLFFTNANDRIVEDFDESYSER